MKATSIKVIVINPYDRTIYPVVMKNDLNGIYKTLGHGAELFEIIRVDGISDILVDEEGLFPGHCENGQGVKCGFKLRSRNYPIFGTGIVVSHNKSGDFTSTSLSAEGVRMMVEGWVQGKRKQE